MSAKVFNELIAELKEIASNGQKTDWESFNSFLKKSKLRRATEELPAYSEEAKLREISGLVPELFRQGIALVEITEDDLANDAKNLLTSTREVYETAFPLALQKWWDVAIQKKPNLLKQEETVQSILLDLDLELPFVNQITASIRSEGWCAVCKNLRNALRPLVSFAQSIVYRCLAIVTHDVCELDALWDLVLERKSVEGMGEIDEVDQDEVDEQGGEEDSDQDQDEEEEEDDESEQTAPSTVPPQVAMMEDQEDEVIEVTDAADFERYLDILKDEVQLISEKRDTVQSLKKLPPQTEEELDLWFGRKTRAAKMIHQVLSRIKSEAWKESDLEALISIYENVAAPAYGIYSELGKYLGNTKTRDVAWVKRLKELLSDVNRLSKILVGVITEKYLDNKKTGQQLKSEQQSKKQRRADAQPDYVRKAVLSYAMCYQNALAFYLERARAQSDEGWQQLAHTLQWTSQLCDTLWGRKIDVSEAAAFLDPVEEDGDAIEEAIWSVAVGDSVNVHPPHVNCKNCKGKTKVVKDLQCLNAKSHLEVLLLKIVVDGHQFKKNSPARLFKAFQEIGATVPPVVFVHSLFKVSNSKNLARELIGLMLKN